MKNELAQIGSDAQKMDNYKATLGYFEEIAQRHPDHLNPSIEFGIEQLLNGQTTESKKTFQHILTQEKSNLFALLGLGECYLREIAPIEALTTFNLGLQSYESEPEFYAKASQAFLSYLLLVSQGQFQDRNLPDELDEDTLLENLILQEKCFEHLPQFLRTLSEFYSRDPAILPLTSERLKSLLKRLYNQNRVTKNLVLVLIFLRDGIEDSIDSKEISKLHQQFFHRFNSEEIKFPYNFSFRGHPFRKNKQDLKNLALRLTSDPQAASVLELHHLLFLSWIDEDAVTALFNQDSLLKILAAKLNSGVTPNEVNKLAAKALLLRYLNEKSLQQKSQLTAIFEVLAVSEDYVKLSAQAAEARSHLASTRDTNLCIAKPRTQTKLYQGWNAVSHVVRTKFSLGRRTSRLKVAVCISGQLRGFRQAFPTWKNTFLADVDYDIFVHTWQRIGRSDPNPFRSYKTFEGENFNKAYKSCFNLLSYEDVIALYPELFSYIKNSQNVTREELGSFYGTDYVVIEDEYEARFDGYSNPDKMHYKIYSCYQYALSQNKDYDLYIRIRPDKPVALKAFDWQDIYRRCRSEGLIFADGVLSTHYGHPAIGDQFAVGDLATMSIYANTWKFVPAAGTHRLMNWPEGLEGHISLALECWAHGIAVEKFPVRWSDLLDSEPIPPQTVLENIKLDATGRMSELDRQFIHALELDCR